MLPPPPPRQFPDILGKPRGEEVTRTGRGRGSGGAGGRGARRRPAGRKGLSNGASPVGCPPGLQHPQRRGGPGTRAFRTRRCPAAGSWGDCPVLGH